MNKFREELKREFGLEGLEAARIWGEFVPFQNRANDPLIWIWVIPDDEKRILVSDGAIWEEQTKRDFFVPFQPACKCGQKQSECNCDFDSDCDLGFPPEGEPSMDSLIFFDGWEYACESWERDALGSNYTLHMIRHLPRRIQMDEE